MKTQQKMKRLALATSIVIISCLTWACSDASNTQSTRQPDELLKNIGSTLQIKTPETQKQLHEIFTQAQQLANDGILTDEQLDVAGSLLSQAHAGQADNFEKSVAQIGQTENNRLDAIAQADLLIRQATELVESSTNLSPYLVKKNTVEFFQNNYPKRQGTFTLFKDFKPTYPADLPPCPQVGDKYTHLLGGQVKKFDYYSKDPVYRELLETPDDQLPDDAALAVAFLVLQNRDESLERDSYTANETASKLLVRFGNNAIPAILEILSNPEEYGQAPSKRVMESRSSFNSLGRQYAYIVAKIPGPGTEPFYRAVFEAGWNDIGSHLPKDDWSQKLLVEFQGSPFGRPSNPRWNRS